METLYCLFTFRHFLERGFLNAPICPIYGFGSLFVIYLLAPNTNNNLTLFVFGMISISALEYLTSYGMEKLFRMRWWDYSGQPLNLNGRISLINASIFGVLCVFLVKALHPQVQLRVEMIPMSFKSVSAAVIFVIVLLDTLISTRSASGLNHKVEQIHRIKMQLDGKFDQTPMSIRIEWLREKSEQFLENQRDNLKELKETFKENLSEMKETLELDASEMFLHEKLRDLKINHNYGERRLLRSFPKLKSIQHNEILLEIKHAMKDFKKDRSNK
jgi:uncharacterized membrane protein